MAEDGPFLPKGDYIGGRFEPPATPTGEIPLEDPGDTTALKGAFPFSAAALGAAVEAARRAYPRWRDTPARERNALLRGLADRLREGRERLALVIAQEAGKPVWEARTEVDAMVGKVAITLEDGLGLLAGRSLELSPTMVGRWRAHSRGVLAVLGPFNFPGHLLNGWVVAALACGNTVVAKPSERTPATGQLYAELVAEAGFPPGAFNLVQGDADQGARLVAHPEVDGVLFTGSWSVGRRILEATLDQPAKLVALEMGGKNACLVCEDADLDTAVYHAAFGAAVTAGQRCSSTSRIIVHRSVSPSFTERLRLTLSRVTPGYPLEEGVFLGPVISPAARERHAELHAWAREEGAEALLEGGPCEGPRPGHYVRPSLHRIPGVRRCSRYQQDEHFVPDVALLECDSLEESIDALNSTDYGLVASVFTRDRSRFEKVHREGRVGLLNWNTSTVGASSRLPFGGVGSSGNHRPAAVLSTLSCTYPVASLEVASPPPPSPPPGFPWPI